MARQKDERILKFPMKGINVDVPRTAQPPDTCVDCQNVRVHDSLADRERGGMRPGLSKYVTGPFNGANRIQDINFATIIAANPPAASSLSYREVKNVAVSGGVVSQFNTTTITNATVTGSATLNATVPFIFSAELFGRLYYADGRDYKIWVGSNNTTIDWSPSAGTLPGTPGTLVPRLIDSWRGRIVLSGLTSDPHNWFMSKLGDPLDWDFAPGTVNETQAVQGGIGVVGKVGDVVNALLPYSDDVMIFGCDHSIWQLLGDPQAGGRMDLLSNTVGMAFGRPFCQDTTGNIYFLSSRGGVYRMAGGGGNPEPMTQDTVESLIQDINLNTTYVRMVWNEDQHGFHLFLTPFTSANTDHWFYDARSNGWFKDRLGLAAFGPTASKVIDGDDPDDRFVLLGGFDSEIRKFDATAADDDGTAITSFVIIGPSMGEEGRKEIIISELQALTDLNSNVIKYEVLSGDTPDQALNTATAGFTGEGTWSPGLGSVENPRERGYYVYYKIGTTAANTQWSLERVRSRVIILSETRGRARQIQGDPGLIYVPPPDPSAPSLPTTNLIMAFWADFNVTVNATNTCQVTAWQFTQQGDTGNTKPTLVNTTSVQPLITTSDSTLNNRASILMDGFSRGFISNTNLFGLDNTKGFIVAGFYIDSSPLREGKVFRWRDPDAPFSTFTHGWQETSSVYGLFNVNTGANVPLFAGQGGTVTFNADVRTIGSWGRGNTDGAGDRWFIRSNATGSTANLGEWWDDVDDGSGLELTISGTASARIHLGGFAVYKGQSNATFVKSVEQVFANYYNVTLP